MSRGRPAIGPVLRQAGGVAILVILGWRLGTGPIVAGLRAVDLWAVLAVTAIAVVTTTCSAWRWSLVARGLGLDLPLPAAIAACYRSQLLNGTLPGGVLGDVHRALHHGRGVGDVGGGLRAVAWERVAGQVVQAVIALVVLVALPSALRRSTVIVAPAVAGCALAGLLMVALVWKRLARALVADLRAVLARRAWQGIALASSVAVAGHATTFLIAARAAGVSASVTTLLPLTMVVLVAMAIPVNIGGWGPREGAAAWLFGTAGLGAAQGLAAGVAYGVLALLASVPGAVVLLLDRFRARPPEPVPAAPRSQAQRSVIGLREGAIHG